ncbi:MAG: N-acetylmuramoyl-L-alanine amidase, partial [Bacilli bacterium]
TATSTGSSTPHYKFSVHDGKAWTIVQDYSTANTFNWTPSVNGAHKFRVFARDVKSTQSYDAYRDKSVSVTTATDVTPPPSAKKTIVIDPGHGGKDSGAVGINGLKEKDVVLDVSLRVEKLFQSKTPYNIFLTRRNDSFLSLEERVSFTASKKGDVFVSVHTNAFNGSASGTETFYYASGARSSVSVDQFISPAQSGAIAAVNEEANADTLAINPYPQQSKDLASFIQKRLLTALKLKDRGVKNGNFHVIRENQTPAVLVELGFIDNKTDNAVLANASRRQDAAQAIYWGILDYLNAKGENVSSYY